MDFSFLEKPEFQFIILKGMGSLIAGLVGALLYFVKGLIRDVRKAIRAVTILTLKFDSFEKQHEIAIDAHRELLEKVREVETDLKIIEHSVFGKNRDNNNLKPKS